MSIFFILKHRLFSNLVSNLQEKWRDIFHFLDITKDNILDLADVTLIQDNYVRLHNLTAEEVCADRETMHEIKLKIKIKIIWGAHSHKSRCTWYWQHCAQHAPGVQCFVHIFTCSPADFIYIRRCILPSVVIEYNLRYEKGLLLRCIHVHHFESDLIYKLDHMRISGSEPSSVILRQTMKFKRLQSDNPKVPKQAEAKAIV